MSCPPGAAFSGLRIHSRGLLLVVHPQICGAAHESVVCPHPLHVNAHDELNSLLRARGGLVVRRDHPELAGSFDWLLREGRLATVLPGVYAAPAIAESWQTGARALCLRHQHAVLLGAAAARISFWQAAPLDHIAKTGPRGHSDRMNDAKPGSGQSSSAPAPSGSISSTLRPVSAASCSTIVR
jgi:hypothetical protein